MIPLVKTGVPGLDELMDGGIPEGSTVLVSGSPGCGKSIMGLQYVYAGIATGEPALYVTFEENRPLVLEQARQFGWDLEGCEKRGFLRLLNFNMSATHPVNIINSIEAEAKRLKAKRIVIDSITVLGVYSEVLAGVELLQMMGVRSEHREIPQSEAVRRGAIMGLVGKLKGIGATSLVISELPESTHFLSRDTVSEYVCDGVVRMMHANIEGKRTRMIEVLKMRLTHIDDSPYVFIIGKGGVSITKKRA
ncbi:Circadian clock protein kinase KaiC [Candidatus Gugararchaeum adminiculabundum]|nr:Circadian clock protein kinase KaiC [Candidatus Gugararchaeum adminiculabundum]